VRLSIINFAGIARTEVAVGTVSDASILATTRAETPRIGSTAAALGDAIVGIGFTIGSAGVDTGAFAGSVELLVVLTGISGVVTGVTFVIGAGVDGAGVDGAEDFGSGGFPPSGAPVSGGRVEAAELLL